MNTSDAFQLGSVCKASGDPEELENLIDHLSDFTGESFDEVSRRLGISSTHDSMDQVIWEIEAVEAELAEFAPEFSYFGPNHQEQGYWPHFTDIRDAMESGEIGLLGDISSLGAKYSLEGATVIEDVLDVYGSTLFKGKTPIWTF